MIIASAEANLADLAADMTLSQRKLCLLVQSSTDDDDYDTLNSTMFQPEHSIQLNEAYHVARSLRNDVSIADQRDTIPWSPTSPDLESESIKPPSLFNRWPSRELARICECKASCQKKNHVNCWRHSVPRKQWCSSDTQVFDIFNTDSLQDSPRQCLHR